MNICNFAPLSVQWEKISSEKVVGESGYVISKTQIVGEIKVRIVEYSHSYLADHWCDKGHIVFVIEGELIIEHKNGSSYNIKKGMSYFVGDNSMPHKAKSNSGAKVFIVD